MIPKILISISGGVLTSIISTEPIDYILIDHDNINAGDEVPDEFIPQDGILSKKEMIEQLTTLRIDKILED